MSLAQDDSFLRTFANPDTPTFAGQYFFTAAARRGAGQARNPDLPVFQKDDGTGESSFWRLRPLSKCFLSDGTTPAVNRGSWGTLDAHWVRLVDESMLGGGPFSLALVNALVGGTYDDTDNHLTNLPVGLASEGKERDGFTSGSYSYTKQYVTGLTGLFWVRNATNAAQFGTPAGGSSDTYSRTEVRALIAVPQGRIDTILQGADTLYDSFKETSDAIKVLFADIDLSNNQYAQLVTLINTKTDNAIFGKAAVLYVAGQGAQGFDSVQAAHDAIPAGKVGTIFLNANTDYIGASKSVTIYGRGFTINRLFISNNAKVVCCADIVGTNTGININYGSVKMYGNIDLTATAAQAKGIVVFPAGNVYMRGNITVSSAFAEASGYASGVGTNVSTFDFDGTVKMTNMGIGVQVQGNLNATIRGRIIANTESAVSLFGGFTDIYASLDNTGGTVSPLKVLVNGGTSSYKFALHSSCELLAAPNVPVIANGNPVYVNPNVNVSVGTTFSGVIPTDVVLVKTDSFLVS